ncbi:transglutaminaseTgpA domain-containing protein [Pseudoalteromonas sp. T1lg65]|uniref:transglutaminase family protein n=1 Tax=Pseudoalteromonas sp. T1lg65 TaxID=2077101 RepID=UPI003F78F734
MNFSAPIWFNLTTLMIWTMSLLLVNEFGWSFVALSTFLLAWQVIRTLKKSTVITTRAINLITLIAAIFTGLFIGFKSSVSLFVALMLIAASLKQIHARTRTQYLQVCILNFFTYPCLFLFTQSLYSTLLVIFMLIINLGIMLNLQNNVSFKGSLRFAVKSFLIILPLTALLVAFMPKLPAFWQLPTPSKQSKTGLSENVDPFSISELAKSKELVFRAEFFNADLLKGPYYWRAIIHDKFDGERWLMSNGQDAAVNAITPTNADVLITAQPSLLPWLYGLEFSSPASSNISSNVFGTVYKKSPANKPFEYQIAVNDVISEQQTISRLLRFNTQIPIDTNNQTRQLAQVWYQESKTTADFIDKVKNYFVENAFAYTLSPTEISSSQVIDAFLFETKNGFCGHYASATAFMLRSVGIPARLVSGYLGGELNQEKGYVSVYQYDAHAWVEYFDPKLGWQRLDPTAWIAPSRISGSLSQFQELSDDFKENLGYSLLAFSDWQTVNWLRLKLEVLDYHWTKAVINFDNRKQSALFEQLFGHNGKLWAGLLSLITIVIVVSAAFYYRRLMQSNVIPFELNLYKQILAHFNQPEHGRTVKQNLRLLADIYPQVENELGAFYAEFEQLHYQRVLATKSQKRNLKKLVSRIKIKGK